MPKSPSRAELTAEIRMLRERLSEATADRPAESRFRELIDLLPQTVYETNTAGYLIFTNHSGLVMFGYSQADVDHGIRFADLFAPEEHSRLYGNIDRILRGDSSAGNEYIARRKDGSTFQALFYSSPILQSARAVGLRGVVIDITKRKQVEKDLHNSRDELRNLATHLQSVREEERSLIAREIHDELGQALTALKMDLIWLLNKTSSENHLFIDKYTSMSALIDRTIQTIRRISTELRPGLIDDLGLTAALEWYSDEFESRAGIRCALKLNENEIAIDQERSIAIFRIFQESLTNIARHARATRVDASLETTDHSLKMEIRDNGIGISPEKINDSRSLGLIGIRERVYPWGGSVNVTGQPGAGTLVQVTIPLDKKGQSA